MKIFVMQNFTRKLVAVLCAIVIWALVNHSITATKLFPRVSCRIVNIPHDKTVRGLMPNGVLDRKVNLTITGRKDVIDSLESSDFEVVIDAAARKGDAWIVQIGKKNLVSVNPDVDLMRNVTGVSYTEFPLKFSKLISQKIPVYFTMPQGEPPEGYQFLDITPQYVTHTLSGPEEDLNELAAKGLEVTFNLGAISKDALDAIAMRDEKDEVVFEVPENWKKVQIPFLGGMKVSINDPEAKNVKILFLRHKLIPLEYQLPLRIFYPVSTRKTLNPLSCKVQHPDSIEAKDDLLLIKKELFAGNVSQLFLDVVGDRMEVVVVLDDTTGKPLSWDVQFVDPEELEQKYVDLALKMESSTEASQPQSSQLSSSQQPQSRLGEKERFLRLRFRNYMKNIKLYMDKDKPFQLDSRFKNGTIVIGDL